MHFATVYLDMNDHNLTTLVKLAKLSFYGEPSYRKTIDLRQNLVRDKIFGQILFGFYRNQNYRKNMGSQSNVTVRLKSLFSQSVQV